MAQPGATTPKRSAPAQAPIRVKAPVLVARAPWPEAADLPKHERWPRAVGMLLAIAVSAGLWALLIWGVSRLVG